MTQSEVYIAICSGHRTIAAVAEHLSITKKAVGDAVVALKGKGAIKRTRESMGRAVGSYEATDRVPVWRSGPVAKGQRSAASLLEQCWRRATVERVRT